MGPTPPRDERIGIANAWKGEFRPPRYRARASVAPLFSAAGPTVQRRPNSVDNFLGRVGLLDKGEPPGSPGAISGRSVRPAADEDDRQRVPALMQLFEKLEAAHP